MFGQSTAVAANLLKLHVALPFVSQTLHEKAVQMRVSPAHDVIPHLFMLFCGVRLDNVGVWVLAAEFMRLQRTARCSGQRLLV
jgi:hypothetical protein